MHKHFENFKKSIFKYKNLFPRPRCIYETISVIHPIHLHCKYTHTVYFSFFFLFWKVLHAYGAGYGNAHAYSAAKIQTDSTGRERRKLTVLQVVYHPSHCVIVTTRRRNRERNIEKKTRRKINTDGNSMTFFCVGHGECKLPLKILHSLFVNRLTTFGVFLETFNNFNKVYLCIMF